MFDDWLQSILILGHELHDKTFWFMVFFTNTWTAVYASTNYAAPPQITNKSETPPPTWYQFLWSCSYVDRATLIGFQRARKHNANAHYGHSKLAQCPRAFFGVRVGLVCGGRIRKQTYGGSAILMAPRRHTHNDIPTYIVYIESVL